MPVTAPERNAMVRPPCRLPRAASAVRTLARTEMFMPMKPVDARQDRADHEADRRARRRGRRRPAPRRPRRRWRWWYIAGRDRRRRLPGWRRQCPASAALPAGARSTCIAVMIPYSTASRPQPMASSTISILSNPPVLGAALFAAGFERRLKGRSCPRQATECLVDAMQSGGGKSGRRDGACQAPRSRRRRDRSATWSGCEDHGASCSNPRLGGSGTMPLLSLSVRPLPGGEAADRRDRSEVAVAKALSRAGRRSSNS